MQGRCRGPRVTAELKHTSSANHSVHMSHILFRPVRLILVAGILCLATACRPAEKTPLSVTPAAEPAPLTSDHAQLAGGEAELQQAIGAARQDLAKRRGVEAESIDVLEAGHVNWRSGAIGCPEPGVYYTQALVPGYRVLLRIGSESFAYHSRQGGAPFLCPSNRAESPAQ